MADDERLTDQDYADLLEFRATLRRFEQWSEERAREAGLTPAQHQLLLAIKGHPDRRGPTIRELAEWLASRHHSVVGLVDRAAAAGLVERAPDRTDGRVVRVRLTRLGNRRIDRLSAVHLRQLRSLAPLLGRLTKEARELTSPD